VLRRTTDAAVDEAPDYPAEGPANRRLTAAAERSTSVSAPPRDFTPSPRRGRHRLSPISARRTGVSATSGMWRGLLLIVVEAVVHGDEPAPEMIAPRPRDLDAGDAHPLLADLHGRAWVGRQVQPPVGMPGMTRIGGGNHPIATVTVVCPSRRGSRPRGGLRSSHRAQRGPERRAERVRYPGDACGAPVERAEPWRLVCAGRRGVARASKRPRRQRPRRQRPRRVLTPCDGACDHARRHSAVP
jgi:hypothetical protein